MHSLHVYPTFRSLLGQPRCQSSLPLTCSPCMLGCTNIENDKTSSIHKVRLTEAISSLGNGPCFVSRIICTVFLVQPTYSPSQLMHKLSFITIKVSHKAYPVLLAPLQLQIQRALAELSHYMAVPCGMSGIFISSQSKLFHYSTIPLFHIPHLQRRFLITTKKQSLVQLIKLHVHASKYDEPHSD